MFGNCNDVNMIQGHQSERKVVMQSGGLIPSPPPKKKPTLKLAIVLSCYLENCNAGYQ